MADENPPDLQFERDENFVELYANNVRFEASAWDMKMIFGLLDQSKTPTRVLQHTSINIPLSQMAITAYFLIVNMVSHQATVGAIPIPTSILPPKPSTMVDLSQADPVQQRTVTYLDWVHEQLFGTPYVPPKLEELIARQE